MRVTKCDHPVHLFLSLKSEVVVLLSSGNPKAGYKTSLPGLDQHDHAPAAQNRYCLSTDGVIKEQQTCDSR